MSRCLLCIFGSLFAYFLDAGEGKKVEVRRLSHEPGHEGQHGDGHAQVRRAAESLSRGSVVQGEVTHTRALTGVILSRMPQITKRALSTVKPKAKEWQQVLRSHM